MMWGYGYDPGWGNWLMMVFGNVLWRAVRQGRITGSQNEVRFHFHAWLLAQISHTGKTLCWHTISVAKATFVRYADVQITDAPTILIHQEARCGNRPLVLFDALGLDYRESASQCDGLTGFRSVIPSSRSRMTGATCKGSWVAKRSTLCSIQLPCASTLCLVRDSLMAATATARLAIVALRGSLKRLSTTTG